MKQPIALCFFILLTFNLFSQVSFEIDATQSGKKISPDLIGAFFEDINYAADGGLYAELIQNRSFEYYPVPGYVTLDPLTAWSLVKKGGAEASMEIENNSPLNINNTRYLKLAISKTGYETCLRNSGYGGIPVEANQSYQFSAYLRADADFDKPVIIRLESSSGTILASDTISGLTSNWQYFSFELTPKQSNDKSSLNLVFKSPGTLYIDMVSLFPKATFKNRTNGLRNDLARAIVDLHPKFLRFPGGCITHGRGNANAYRWKETIGDVAWRKPNWNLWGYHQTYGLGFFEYFQFCEDIGAKPLPVLPLGISCQFRTREIVPLSEMSSWVQDAIDLVEFANGDTTTTWGKIRGEMGHPASFNLEYLCLGNEEDDIPEFRERFILMANALRKAHPEIRIIGTSGTAASGTNYNSLWQFSRDQDLYAVDEHYYMDPSWFTSNLHRYDNFERTGPQVFIGEYASKDDRLANAIAEAAYLTCVERNADIIRFTCYAPLLCREPNNQWHPDLIRFDNTTVVKTASYYVQQLFSQNPGDEVLTGNLTYDPELSIEQPDYSGHIGVGTWNTRASFDSIKVESGGKVLIEDNFSQVSSNWEVLNGTFAISGGTYVQSTNLEPAWSLFKVPVDTSVYTLTLKAKKTSGQEGFLIPFGFINSSNFYWLNIAGWGNTQHAIEKAVNGSKTTLVSKAGSIENNRWYAIKIEIRKSSARCFLDGQLLFEVPAPDGPVSASVTRDTLAHELIFKLVNSGHVALSTQVNLTGSIASQTVKLHTLTGEATSRNSVEAPETLIPTTSNLSVGNRFEVNLPAQSLVIFRVKVNPDAHPSGQSGQGKDKLRIVPNPMKKYTKLHFDNPHANQATFSFYDCTGRLILNRDGIFANSVSLERNSLVPGIYIARIVIDGKNLSGKVVIQ